MKNIGQSKQGACSWIALKSHHIWPKKLSIYSIWLMLELMTLCQSYLTNQVREYNGWSEEPAWVRRFSEAKAWRFEANGSNVAGTVTMLGALFGYLHHVWAPGETIDHRLPVSAIAAHCICTPWRHHGGGLASIGLVLVFSVENLGYPCDFICFIFICFVRGNSH
jgi:hypothetical protein